MRHDSDSTTRPDEPPRERAVGVVSADAVPTARGPVDSPTDDKPAVRHGEFDAAVDAGRRDVAGGRRDTEDRDPSEPPTGRDTDRSGDIDVTDRRDTHPSATGEASTAPETGADTDRTAPTGPEAGIDAEDENSARDRREPDATAEPEPEREHEHDATARDRREPDATAEPEPEREHDATARDRREPDATAELERESADELKPGEVPAPAAAERWGQEAAEQFRERWREVQFRFVDDPRAAAGEAETLTVEAIESLTTYLSAQRDELAAWKSDGVDDTEQLRVALRRYREFLDRILTL